MVHRRNFAWMLLLALLVPILAACGGNGGGGGGTTASPAAEGSAPAAEGSAPAAGGGGGTDTGQVEILGAFTGPEAEAFEAVVRAFEEANPGIDVTYVGSQDFDTQVEVRVQAGDPPDIAGFPQPGGMARLARNNQAIPLWPEAISLIEENYAPVWVELGSVDGTPYGVFHRVNAKGFVWYNKPEWEAAGYEAPQTWDELMTLTEELKGTDRSPWCEGIESGAATGWKGTDWIESILLRTQPGEFYDQWVAGEVPFTSPEVTGAFERLGEIWLDPEAVYGGQQTIALTQVPQAATYLFGSPPNCWLHFQGSFVTNFFPEDVQQNVDEQVGFFVLPVIGDGGEGDGPPALVGGDVYTMLQDRPEVRRFMEFLATTDSTAPWAEQGGALFPHRGQDFSVYPTEIERQVAQTIVEAEQVRFDGSDQMASELNQAFWQGVTNWVSGNRDLNGALQDIDQARPQ
jgi:alpha-glucoside transport system substrate-binding protein